MIFFTAQFGYIGCGFASQDSFTFSSNVNAVVQTRFHHHEKLKKILKKIVLTWLLHSRSVLERLIYGSGRARSWPWLHH
ncbi:unnamed protein product [Musa acuminata subsp. burmannicoides]